MRNKKVQFIVQSAAIAAIYVVLTVLFAPIGFGEVQIRFAEALTVLPFFTPAAVPGLFVGCVIGNLLGGAIPLDVIFGSLATLLGAMGTYMFRRYRFLAPVFPILANTIVVPQVLYYGYSVNLPIPFMMVTVGVGEVVSCGILGMILLFALEKYRGVIFKKSAA